ncbi:amino acid adenylation domain-containing protein, partial [Mucilaginibacter sp.]|uniref:amino acid adenylation domain-containing protein n=1 Tax=Mucilaginibacter sp. TaxID=1882438 RepID=UPI002ED2C300
MNIEPGNILKNGESIAPNVYDLFEQQRIKLPDAIAVVHNSDSFTYSELYQKADHLALAILNSHPDSEIIGISANRGIQTIIGVLAILKAGKGYLPLDPDYPKERLETIIKDSGITVCITSSDKKHLFDGLPVNILLSDAFHKVSTKSFQQTQLDDIAYVLYTSGSTGAPKGVSMGNAALVNLLLWQQENSISAQGINTLQFAPLTFDVSFQEIFATLGTGGTLFLVDEELRIDPVKLLQFIDEHAINRIFLPFVVLQYLTEAAIANNYVPVSLKEVMTAGEQLKITPQIASFFNVLPDCVLYNQYGPTETHVVTQLKLDGSAALWPALPSIGSAISNTEIILLDENLNRVTNGETGELCVSGISLANGYLNKAGLTAEKFIDWTEGNKTIRIYRTGDLARFMGDGNIEYLGRRDTQVKIRGNRVEIGEIEVLIGQLDNIKQVVVTAPADAAGQKRLVAYLVSSGDTENTESIRKSLEQQLPDFMLPSAYVWLTELPKTTSGKVDRKALPKPDIKRPEFDVLYKAPSNSIEKNIAIVLIELLQFDKVGVEDNF